jgi:hypothetical protein
MPDRKSVIMESHSEIGQYQKILILKETANRLRQCYSKISELQGCTGECWCRKAGDNDRDLPCPT